MAAVAENTNGDRKHIKLRSDSTLGEPQWAAALLNEPDTTIIIDGTALIGGAVTGVAEDHMFTAFLHHDLLRDLVCVYNERSQEVYTLYHLGMRTCGHPGVVHGGLTSAIIDETFGALMYMLKARGLVEEGPAFTANLTVDYRAPIPAGIEVMCKCWLESTERRKIWLRSELRDRPDGTLFAEGRALFINARKGSEAHKMATTGNIAGQRPQPAGREHQEQQQDGAATEAAP